MFHLRNKIKNMPPTIPVFIITGASKGIGKETARIIASRNPNAQVIATGTNQQSIDAALSSFNPSLSNIVGFPLELTDFKSIETFVDAVKLKVNSSEWEIAAVLHNAGMQVTQFEKSAAGLEKTFHCNHVGTFYLNKLLLPYLNRKDGSECRVFKLYLNILCKILNSKISRVDYRGFQ